MLPIAFSIKNTFVEIEEEEDATTPLLPPRRCASVPPGAKLCLGASETEGPANRLLEFFTEEEKAGAADSGSTVGEGSLSSVRGSSDEGSWDADVCSVCTHSSDVSDCSTLHPSDSASNQEGMAPEVASNVPVRMMAPHVPRIVCMRQAQLWQSPWEALQAVAVAAVTALVAMAQPELNKTCFGWQVVIKLTADKMHLKDHLLSSAKAAIMAASERSQGTYVVGYRLQPFMDSPLGFSAILAHISRPAEACWDLLQWGTCRFEGSCRWRHPEERATLGVMVVPAEEVPRAESTSSCG